MIPMLESIVRSFVYYPESGLTGMPRSVG